MSVSSLLTANRDVTLASRERRFRQYGDCVSLVLMTLPSHATPPENEFRRTNLDEEVMLCRWRNT